MGALHKDLVDPEVEGFAAAKLASILSLSEHYHEIARSRLRGTTRSIKGGRDIVRQGSIPLHAVIIIDGWAAVSRSLSDGRRQTQAILLPGDLYNLDLFSFNEADHALTALGPLTYLEIRRERMRLLADEFPPIAKALWRHDLLTASAQREWIVNLGCRTATERIAHLFCELHERLRPLGLVHGNQFEMRLTQSDIAEATGLTAVHANRTIQQLRGANLVELNRNSLMIGNLSQLKRVALYSEKPSPLHVDQQKL